MFRYGLMCVYGQHIKEIYISKQVELNKSNISSQFVSQRQLFTTKTPDLIQPFMGFHNISISEYLNNIYIDGPKSSKLIPSQCVSVYFSTCSTCYWNLRKITNVVKRTWQDTKVICRLYGTLTILQSNVSSLVFASGFDQLCQ